jgi:GTP-binding protein
VTAPVVAIVGRPNVGKSTLFNRILRQRLAIVHGEPGTTRDRIYARTEWRGRPFYLVDTAGLDPAAGSELEAAVQAQVRRAIQEASAVVFVGDAQTGLTAADWEAADLLRASGKPVILAVNKAEGRLDRLELAEFYRLGLGEPVLVSALHGIGIDALLDRILEALPPAEPAAEPEAFARVAVVGRPNVGKSMLLNAIVGYERTAVSEIPGTTRDVVDTLIEYRGHPILLIDTAGIRRRGRVQPGVERFSVLRAVQAIERCDVAVLMIDGAEGVTAQDAHIGGLIVDAYKGVVIAVNKWDLVPNKDIRAYEAYVRSELKFLDYAPVVFTSAKLRQGTEELMDQVILVRTERRKRIPTAELNELLGDILFRHPPPRRGRRQLKIYYATQAETDPPTFVFFCNDPELVHFSYQRYIENQLRSAYGFVGNPIRLIFRARARETR